MKKVNKTSAYLMGESACKLGIKPDCCPFHHWEEDYFKWMDGYFNEFYKDMVE